MSTGMSASRASTVPSSSARNVTLVAQYSRHSACVLNVSFGREDDTIWISGGCRGRFRCGNAPPISCGAILDPGHRVIRCMCGDEASPALEANGGGGSGGPDGSISSISSSGDGSGSGGSTGRCAICLTGLLRTLIELPTRTSYHVSVQAPLLTAGWVTDAHIVVSSPSQGDHGRSTSRSDPELRKRIEAAYSPRSVTLLPDGEATRWVTAPQNRACAIDGAARWRNTGTGDAHHYSVLLQYVAAAACYDQVEAAEKRDGAAYDWLVRLRSDLTLLAPCPLAAGLSEAHVYVPVNGMTGVPQYRCMNDHAFLCPRALCRPHFKLLELWQSEQCCAAGVDAAGSAADIGFNRGASLSGAPTVTYRLPPPPVVGNASEQIGGQWYSFARYATNVSRGGAPCNAHETTAECCGALREIAWPSALAHSREEGLQCKDRLRRDAPGRWQPDAAARPWLRVQANLSTYLARCYSLQEAWQWGALRPQRDDPYWSRVRGAWGI
jgi:hypothetical protein